MGSNNMSHRQIHNRVATGLRQKGLTVLDPVALFEKGNNPLGYYFRSDPHWNRRAHQVVGQELTRLIRAEKSVWLL